MTSVAFELIRGHRVDSTLLWIPADQHLYYKKCARNGQIEYECYQTILRKNGKSGFEFKYCTAGAVIKDGICTHKVNGHTVHPNHSQIVKNLKARNNILDQCIAMKEITEDLCVKVPAQNIFIREMSKLVCLFKFFLLHFWVFS